MAKLGFREKLTIFFGMYLNDFKKYEKQERE